MEMAVFAALEEIVQLLVQGATAFTPNMNIFSKTN